MSTLFKLKKTSIGMSKPKRNSNIMTQLSKVGKALMFPIAMLPFAAILLRIGAAIPTTSNGGTVFSTAVANLLLSGANVVFANLAILFGVGLAFGLSKKNRGEAALVGFIGVSLVMAMMSSNIAYNNNGEPTKSTTYLGFFSSGIDLVNLFYGSIINFHDPKFFGNAYNSILANNVFTGLLVGIFVAWIYNKFHKVEMPGILGFFSGRRLVPAMVIMFIMVGILVYAAIWPWIGYGISEFSRVLAKGQGNRWSNSLIMFVFGILNRLLLPFGLHNVPNTLFWFTPLGGTQGAFNGDINIFLKAPALGNHAGTFQSGFFPIMMFGLPALVFAIHHKSLDSQKIKVLGLLGGSAVISFFTGITEPIEYAFLYAAPLLYGMHIILTGIFSFIVGAFGIQVGFAFSAGFIDYVLSIPKSLEIVHVNYSGFDAIIRNPFWIIPIGVGAAATYYFLGGWLIERYNLSTPGRNDNLIFSTVQDEEEKKSNKSTTNNNSNLNKIQRAAKVLLEGLGGKENIVDISNCATRLRLTLKDASKVDETKLKRGGSLGLIRISSKAVQVVIGPTVEMYVNAIEELL